MRYQEYSFVFHCIYQAKMSQITVSVSGDNNTLLKEITMNSGETMPDLITALESIKSQTNVFLTELVQASNTKGPVNTGKSDRK